MKTKIERRTFIQWAIGGTAAGFGFVPFPAFGAKQKKISGSLPGPTFEDSIELLNLWSKKSESVNRLFIAIHKVLEKNMAATFAEAAQATEVQALFETMKMSHLGGPLLGCIDTTGVKIWLRTTRPAEVTVEVDLDGRKKMFGPVGSTPISDLTAIVSITGLKPNTVYSYNVYVDGKQITIPKHAAIKTPPADKESHTRIAFGTCQHRLGLGNMKNAEQILKFNPHAMLVYGDIAVQDRSTHLGMHRADYVLRDFHPAWNDLACTMPFYACWDDHDYGSNDAFGLRLFGDKERRGIRNVFTQNWNNPSYGFGDEGGGIFTRARVGCCDIIMTDNRYFRQDVPGCFKSGKEPKNGETRPRHAFLGSEQMEWLKKTLLDCKGPFIIITCGTMWDDVAAKGKDSWGIWDPEGREEIYKLIEENRIPGVLFLSGDRHGARIFRIPRPAGHEFYEFEVATLGGKRSITPPMRPEWDTLLFGMQSKFAHGQFTFDLSKEDPTVSFTLMGDTGEALFEHKLTRSQLTPKQA